MIKRANVYFGSRRSGRRLVGAAVALLCVVLIQSAAAGSTAAIDDATAAGLCAAAYPGTVGPDPLSPCQWDMKVINAGAAQATATGAGVTVGVIDGGVDFSHPDLAGGIDVAKSCSFIYSTTPTADPSEIANGDCSNKAAVQDLQGHGTHVSTTIAGRVNGVGIVGVAPQATIVGLKACTIVGYCFADSVAAALRYAGDQRLDVVNLSLFADPYLYFCANEAGQRAVLLDLQGAARYAQQRGVVIVAAAGNEAQDLGHPDIDEISPDWPPDSAIVREVGNNCRVTPAELPGVVAVSASGVNTLASYSNVGGPVDVRSGRRCRADTGHDVRARAHPRRLVEHRRHRVVGVLLGNKPRDSERRGSVCLDQRHLDGLAPRGRCRSAHPGQVPEHAAGSGCGSCPLVGNFVVLPDQLARWGPAPVHRRPRPDLVLRSGDGER